MSLIQVKNFKGVFEKVSEFDSPNVYAEVCRDFLPTYAGKLVKRNGYTAASLNDVAFVTTGLTGNIINMHELITGRAATSAPDESKIYLCQTDNGNGEIYRWNESTGQWTDITHASADFRDADGDVQKCRFLDDSGVVRILAGNRSVNEMLWWGYNGDRFSGAISANAGTITKVSGAFPSTAALASLDRPKLSDYITSSVYTDESFGTWETYLRIESVPPIVDTYAYKIAIQYDNKQWTLPSPLESDQFVNNLSGSRIKHKIAIPASGLDQRITGIALFRKWTDGSLSLTDAGPYYLVAIVYLNDTWGDFDNPNVKMYPYEAVYKATTYDNANKRFSLDTSPTEDDSLATDLYNDCLLIAKHVTSSNVYTCRITDTVASAANTQYFDVADNTGLTDKDGDTFNVMVVRGWMYDGSDYICTLIDDITQEAIVEAPVMSEMLGFTTESVSDVFPKYGVMIGGQAFYGNAYHNNETKEHVISYGLLNSDGLFSNDVHRILNAFTTGFPLVGLSSIGDRLIPYGGTKIARGIIPTANERTWDFERLYDKFGLLAENSLVNIQGKDYFLASDWKFKVFDGISKPITISDGIHKTIKDAGDTSLTYLQNVVGFFMPKLNLYCIKLQTGSDSYEYWGYDVSGNEIGWIQFAWHETDADTDQNFSGFFVGDDGSPFAFVADALYLLNSGTDDDGVDIDPEYLTNPLTMNKRLRNHLTVMVLTYKSDSAIEVDLYLDGGGTAVSQTDATCAAKTALGILEKNLPLGTFCRYFKVKFHLNSTQRASNTDFEIDELEFPVEFSGGDV